MTSTFYPVLLGNLKNAHEIWGSHDYEHAEFGLVWCDVL
jgi:hypothetical protein